MNLLTAATVTGPGNSFTCTEGGRTFQATVTGTGIVSATVNIEVSNDNTAWLTLGTMSASGTTQATDGLAANAKWDYTRANVTAISGTGAAVTVTMGVR